MNHMSLKTKMTLAVSLLVTSMLLLVALFVLWYFDRQVKDTIYRQQFTLVSAMAEEIDGKLLNARKALVAVARITKPDLTGNAAKAQAFLDDRPGTRTVFDSGLFIFLPDGRRVASSPPEPLSEGGDYCYLAYIANTLATREPRISAPFLPARHRRHPIVMFSAPFFDSQGKVAGVVAGAVDLMSDNFLGKLATVKIGKKGYLYLYSTDRTLIVHPDTTRILRRDVPPGVNRLFDRAIEGFEGTGETVTSRGLHAVSSFKRLRSVNWILAANFPQEEVYAPIRTARLYLGAALLLALFVSIFFVWWFMSRLTAPLLRLTEHVTVIADKEQGPAPIRVTSHDEIGTLARAFNEMLGRMELQKKSIQEQKNFSEKLLLNSAVPTFVLDAEHRVVIWNRACEELTGIQASDVIGTTDSWKAFHSGKSPALADIVIDAHAGKIPFPDGPCASSPFAPGGLQAEGWHTMTDGGKRYIFFDAAPVRGPEGEIVAVIQTVQDLTGRRKVEEELEFKNIILSTQQETSIDGILVVDGNGAIISFNRRFVELWDLPPELVKAGDDAPVLRLIASRVADPESFVARVRHLYEHKGETGRDELLLADGRVFERYSAPILGEDGKYYGRVWYFRDISESKQMEKALRESEERYRKLVELSPDAIYIHTGGVLVFANAAGARLLGAERPEDIYGRQALDFVHPDYRDLVTRRLGGLKLDGEKNPVIEEVFVRFDGSCVDVDVSSLVFMYQGKEAFLIVARDTRERKKMQEELIKAQKLESLGVLAGGIAHDFNNILTGILGSLSLANARLDPSHAIAKHLLDCEKAAVRASQLTRQLLTFSRGGEPVKKIIDPALIIRETASFVLRGTNVRSVIDLADGLWNISADSGQISQALHNILINAVQAMPGGGEVTVRAENETFGPENAHQLAAGNYIRIVLEDRGCGIPPENLVSIFDPYFTTKAEGSGLGLASVYSIVKRHGGAVEVSSTIGVGSSFTIHLPALPGTRAEEEAVGKAPESAGIGGRILVMDDEESIRDIATQMLEFMGYEVESCNEGREAVERFRTAWERGVPFDAVILDLTVPGGMGGREAAAHLLEIDHDAVLIVSSGYSNDPVIANFRSYGFSGVVPKPFTAATLAGELERLVSRMPGE